MKRALIITGIVVALVLMVTGIFIVTNNRVISLEEQILLADSDIQIQEKRRTDLIYNLVDCVKEYDKHEAQTLLAIVQARGDNVDINEITEQLFITVEDYPQLESSANYRELMNELAITENKISEYRNSYNNQVREYNKYVRKFPHKQILGMLGYEVIDYKYLEYSEKEIQSVMHLFED